MNIRAELNTEVVVLGGGPGGYTAAFRAADLGKKVIIVERRERLGGVCLNVGCIPSKTYLHAVSVIEEASEFSNNGIEFGAPKIDAKKLCVLKNKIVLRLTAGLIMLAKKRNIDIVCGTGKFITANQLEVEEQGGAKKIITFEHAIIAAGSEPSRIASWPLDSRIMDSTQALELEGLSGSLLIIGAGVIGLEMATVYRALGASVTLVDSASQIMPGADVDLITPLMRRLQKQMQAIYLETLVQSIDVRAEGLYVTFTGKHAGVEPVRFDRILYAIGRVPNGLVIAADRAGVQVDNRGFIAVDQMQRTNIANIYAIGDIVGNPMLAHKASYEGRRAAEAIAGVKALSERTACIPAVAYTHPEIAWVGVTEEAAKQKGIDYGKGVFPWVANGRAQSLGQQEGATKLLFAKDTNYLIGAGIVGHQAGELIAELAFAIERKCTAHDIANIIHPHPTLSETVMMAAEVFEKTVTDLFLPRG